MSNILSYPTIYAKDYRFVRTGGKVKPLQHFIITGKGSKCESGDIRYYWRLVRGLAPSILDVTDNGMTVYMRAPEQPTEVEFELKVKDLETKEVDTKSIIIEVIPPS